MAALRDFPDAGGRMAYSADTLVIYRNMARYADCILRGARPAELPFQEPTTYELVVVNLKTAKMLGLVIPAPVLLQADRVIE